MIDHLPPNLILCQNKKLFSSYYFVLVRDLGHNKQVSAPPCSFCPLCSLSVLQKDYTLWERSTTLYGIQ